MSWVPRQIKANETADWLAAASARVLMVGTGCRASVLAGEGKGRGLQAVWLSSWLWRGSSMSGCWARTLANASSRADELTESSARQVSCSRGLDQSTGTLAASSG